jgi:hypothetical protein
MRSKELARATFALTKGTQKMRWVIHAFTVLLLLFFGTSLALVTAELASAAVSTEVALSTAKYVVLGLRQLAFALAFTATAVFYLRWNNAWFQQHAQEEFRLKQLELDFDRASWVVEMSLEWKDDRQTELPPELLSRLTTGLFLRTEGSDEPLHPADHLASALFGSAAELELTLPNGNGRVRLDRKSLNALKKQKKQDPPESGPTA